MKKTQEDCVLLQEVSNPHGLGGKKMFGWGGGGITKFTDYNYPSGNYTDSSYRFHVDRRK